MNQQEMKNRTKDFALRILKLCQALPHTTEGRVIKNQIIRSGTSVAANYRASCRARSKAEFISKLGTVEEEVDESAFWLEIIIERNILSKKLVELLLNEAYELTAIIVSTRKSSRNNKSTIEN